MQITRPDYDISSLVFVHGLNPKNAPNFAEQAWTHANGTFWPKELLPQEIPQARVLLFGYNSNVALDVSHQGVKEHANTLLDRLVRKRDATEVTALKSMVPTSY